MAHFEDCKFFLRGTCVKGLRCGFRHNEASCHTERLCNRWAAGYLCDGRCNLRHPSAAELAALAASPPPTPAAAGAPMASRAAAPPGQLSAAKPHVQQQQQQQGRDGMAKNARAPSVAAATAPPCRFHARGLCAKGNACPFSHAPLRTAQVAAAAAPAPAPAVPAATAPTAAARMSAMKGGRGGKTYPAPNTLRGAAAAARKAADSGKSAAAVPGGSIAGQRGGRQAARAAAGASRGNVAASAAAGAAGGAGGGGTGDVGVKAETDAAAAKGRAAEILQKHRLSSSAAALDAKSRGGMSVQGGPPMGKKVRTEPPLRRQPQPRRPATSGDAAAAVAGVAVPQPPAKKYPEKQAGNGLALEGKETQWDCGEEGEWGKADASAGADGAPACDGAVARVPSDLPRHERRQERPEPAVGETSAGAAAAAAVAMDVAETSTSSDSVSATGAAAAAVTTDAAASAQPRPASNGSSQAASLIPGAAAATVIAGDKEGVPQDRAGGVVGGGGGGGRNPGVGGGAGRGDVVESDAGGERPSQGDASGETRRKDAEAPTLPAGAAVAPAAGSLQES